jgi:hypothetical protein
MRGRIESGQLCTVVPVDPANLEVGDIVLCKVKRQRVPAHRQGDPGWSFSNWEQPGFHQWLDWYERHYWKVHEY